MNRKSLLITAVFMILFLIVGGIYASVEYEKAHQVVQVDLVINRGGTETMVVSKKATPENTWEFSLEGNLPDGDYSGVAITHFIGKGIVPREDRARTVRVRNLESGMIEITVPYYGTFQFDPDTGEGGVYRPVNEDN